MVSQEISESIKFASKIASNRIITPKLNLFDYRFQLLFSRNRNVISNLEFN